ncbi:YgdI/YgdR family lipoprotein [Pseudomonas sp.]|jgi:hypothetical protein|uniref:YgdI/YgdR family lipoprotein n=1 Tax=Pseudomonas sp. TaxID=306 RepID=UPI002729BB61|nr:YgdI/YgdR family lipoprotein [Pseudomonas sp.]
MNKLLPAALLVFGSLTLAACSNDHIIGTTDGRMIESESKPEIDEDTNMIRYEDDDGRENQLPASDVREIKER